MVVYATDNKDHGNSEDLSVRITVEILDVNDNDPIFTNIPHTEYIYEVSKLYS